MTVDDLPNPLHPAFGRYALLFFFTLHILAVNVAIGGPWLALWSARCARARSDQRHALLARHLASITIVDLSVLVVMGVATLLFITMQHTVPFVTAALLVFPALFAVVPLLIGAFGLLYAYRFWWDRFASVPGRHASLAAIAGLVTLGVGLIFTGLAALTLHPESWRSSTGFIATMAFPTFWPRYLHTLLASVAVTGLAIVGYALWGRWRGREEDAPYYAWARGYGTAWAFGATLAQVVTGLWYLLSLPGPGRAAILGGSLTAPFGLALLLAIAGLVHLHLARRGVGNPDRLALLGGAFLLVTVGLMVATRNGVREAVLAAVGTG